MAKIEIKIGDQFNDWTVVDIAAKRNVNEYYHCVCRCGLKREVFRGSLLGGRSKSCGCRTIGVKKDEVPLLRK